MRECLRAASAPVTHVLSSQSWRVRPDGLTGCPATSRRRCHLPSTFAHQFVVKAWSARTLPISTRWAERSPSGLAKITGWPEEVVWATGGEGGRLTLSAPSAGPSVFRRPGCPSRAPIMKPDWSIRSDRHFCGAGVEGRGRALRNGDGLTDRMTRTAKPEFPRACIMLPAAGTPRPISPRGR